MVDCASFKVIDKFCELRPGEASVTAITNFLVEAIEKDVIESDFTPDEIKHLNPGLMYSQVIPPFRKRILQYVRELKRIDDRSTVIAFKKIDGVWRRVKNTYPHRYLCRFNRDCYIYKVNAEGGRQISATTDFD